MGEHISPWLAEMKAPGQFQLLAFGSPMPPMTTVEDIRHANLLLLIEEYRTIQKLADTLGKSHSQVSQLKNKSVHSVTKEPRTIGKDLAREIERKTGKPEGWMDRLHAAEQSATYQIENQAGQAASTTGTALVPNSSQSLSLLPVVEWVKGDEMLSIQNDDLNLRSDVDCLTAPGVQSPRAKFFVVPDDAMAPDILRGEYVALDPAPLPQRGDYVLVKRVRTGELMLRQYRPVDDEEFNAVPLNTSKYDPFNSRQHGLELLAVLVGHWSGRRSERH